MINISPSQKLVFVREIFQLFIEKHLSTPASSYDSIKTIYKVCTIGKMIKKVGEGEGEALYLTTAFHSWGEGFPVN